MNKISIVLSIAILTSGILFADDKSEVSEVVKKHWDYQNNKNWKKFTGTMHSSGTMNGDSNGSFWYMQESTLAAVTQNQQAGDSYNFQPRYIEVDVLEKNKVAVAYYYLVGSYEIAGNEKSDYRTRVSQIFVKEKGNWKVKSGHFTALHSGSGIPN